MESILYTPAQDIQIINKVKDSKFYGSIASVSNENEAKKFIIKIKDKFNDASHNVSAYKIGSGDQALKHFDDDGEPAGSSGPPVLQAIEGAELVNTVVVVTRYFGGTKLGIGGLIRAYGNTARIAIEEAGTKKLTLLYKILVKGDYSHIGVILGQVEAFHGKIIATEYTNDGGQVELLLLPKNYIPLKKQLIEMTGANVEITKENELYS